MEKGGKVMSISNKVRLKQTDSVTGVSEVGPYHRPLFLIKCFLKLRNRHFQHSPQLVDIKMGFLNLMWDTKFIKTRPGMTMTTQCVGGFVGGLFGFVWAYGFESFLLWGAFFGSGLFLFTHVTNMTQALEARFHHITTVVSK